MKKYAKLIVVGVVLLFVIAIVYFYLQNRKEKECLGKINFNPVNSSYFIPSSQSTSGFDFYHVEKWFKTQEEAMQYCIEYSNK